jgi:hypothetical protein
MQQWRETAKFVIETDSENKYPVYAHPFFEIYFNKIFSSKRKVYDSNELKQLIDNIKKGEDIPGFWICEAHFFVDNAVHEFFNKNLIKQIEKGFHYAKATLYTSYVDLKFIPYFRIPLSKLNIYGRVEVQTDEGVTMPWNVKLETPEISFRKGIYELEIEAKGSSVDKIFSRLKIYSEGILKENIIYLTENYQNYKITFEVLKNLKGKLAIEFDNDAYKPQIGEDRNVWLRSIEFKRVR